ncbi:MAG: excinuclease ABC subunit B, partial [Candidatus Hydrothermae bacterium]|nr:excinuclease ABC subunit B [Candidatus Hydrothermae bacterium]
RMLRRLVDLQYTRNDTVLKRGTFRARGDVVELIPAYEEHVVRVEFWGDEVERLAIRDPLTGEILEEPDQVAIYPAGHWLTSEEKFERALQSIEAELRERVRELEAAGKILEARRLEQRTRMDLELLRATGTCPGVENYSRHLAGRAPGERPYCLVDYFPDDFLLVIDESHVTIPQLQGMYRGDRSRKQTLVEYGFRLPSALDNRPLRFEELEALWNQVLFVSATPGPYELEKTHGWVVEQIIRPTGLVDPEILVKPTRHQMDVVLDEVRKRAEKGERVLITTLTKRMAEDLADYLVKHEVRARYLHSEMDAIERVQLLRDLRLGEFDVLVGVNLLREGLDLPEVSLVIILDADKTGFLRSERSLIQMAGRAARNAAGQVILFADEITPAMERAIQETQRRRTLQLAYNREHGIIPRTIRKSPEEIMRLTRIADERVFTRKEDSTAQEITLLMEKLPPMEALEELERRMKQAADLWEFERAAQYRDAWLKLKASLRSKT